MWDKITVICYVKTNDERQNGQKTKSLPNGGKKLQIYQMEEKTYKSIKWRKNYKSTKWRKKPTNLPNGGKNLQIYQMKDKNYKSTKWRKKTTNLANRGKKNNKSTI